MHSQNQKTLVDKRWPKPSDADADARTTCENQRFKKYKDYFLRGLRGLTPPALKQKAHQGLFEGPEKTGEARQTLIIIKDTSLVINAEMSGLQKPSSGISTDFTDSSIANIEKTLNEISNIDKNHRINATYDPNNTKMILDNTRF